MTAYTFSQLFDFTRTTAGTFVGSNGLIQNTPASRNLLTFTQEFDNVAWVKDRVTVAANAAVAPDGTTTADSVIATVSATNQSVYRFLTVPVGTFTLSVFAKANGVNWLKLFRFDAGPGGAAWFDLSTGTVGTVLAGYTAAITAVGNGWYRCSITASYASGTIYPLIGPVDGDNSNALTSTTSGIFLWGAQLELGSSATTYTRNNGGLFPARFDYDPVTLAPRGILIEEQRTNLLTYSQELNSAPWLSGVGYNSTIPANTALAPDGTVTADTLLADNAGGTGSVILARGLSAISGTTYTFSFFAKRNTLSWISLYLLNFTTPANGGAFFDLASGSIGTVDAGRTATITDFGNGWYRCAITFTAGATVSTELRVYLASANNSTTVNRNGTDSVFLWGAQLEVGAFATSYIPTVASQVTRSADICNLTAPMFTPWYNTNEGTFVVEADTSFVGNFPVVVGYSAASTASFLYVTSGGKIGTWNGTNALDAVAGATTTNNAVFKAANAYAASSRNISMNGAAVASDANAVGSASFIALGKPGLNTSQMLNGHIRSIRYYPFRASNNQLQALTT